MLLAFSSIDMSNVRGTRRDI